MSKVMRIPKDVVCLKHSHLSAYSNVAYCTTRRPLVDPLLVWELRQWGLTTVPGFMECGLFILWEV